MSGIYLDHNATAPIRPEAAAAMADALTQPGNASSVHASGRRARRLIEDARETLAARLNAPATGVIFTSGASEANALALTQFRPGRVIASAVEHPSVLAWADARIPVDGNGVIDLDALDRLLSETTGGPVLVALMLVNNETGVVQPVAEAARIARAHGAGLHCDAVQALSRMDIDIMALGVDSLAVSAHKIGGPQGVGALVLADPERVLRALIPGGGQERSRRGGTENLPGIAGFAAALNAPCDNARIEALRDALERRARDACPALTVLSSGARRVGNTACLAVPGTRAETVVMALDLAGIMVSAGAACSSGKVGPSHVLEAMGADSLAGSAIRVSLGWTSGPDDVDGFIAAFSRLAGSRRAQNAA